MMKLQTTAFGLSLVTLLTPFSAPSAATDGEQECEVVDPCAEQVIAQAEKCTQEQDILDPEAYAACIGEAVLLGIPKDTCMGVLTPILMHGGPNYVVSGLNLVIDYDAPRSFGYFEPTGGDTYRLTGYTEACIVDQ